MKSTLENVSEIAQPVADSSDLPSRLLHTKSCNKHLHLSPADPEIRLTRKVAPFRPDLPALMLRPIAEKQYTVLRPQCPSSR